jgi:hypothetical protein
MTALQLEHRPCRVRLQELPQERGGDRWCPVSQDKLLPHQSFELALGSMMGSPRWGVRTARIYSHGKKTRMSQNGYQRGALLFILVQATGATQRFAQAPLSPAAVSLLAGSGVISWLAVPSFSKTRYVIRIVSTPSRSLSRVEFR